MSIQPGCQFASDNTAGICPEAMSAMTEANQDAAKPYGEDPWTKRATLLIRDIFEIDCDVFFTFNGTAANALALSAMCQSHHGVLAHRWSHVETDECGAPEFFCNGSKILLVPGENGRVDGARVMEVAGSRTDVHFPKAKALSITQSTEVGTVYDLDMLQGIEESVRRCNLSFHMDGARFANAIATLGVAPSEMTWKRGVDVLSLGGTKNGMAVGDCVVFFNRELGKEFEYRCKQAGQLASKMRFLSAPWVGLLTDDTWLRNAQHANAMAQRLATGLQQLGVRIAAPVESNAVFADLTNDQTAAIRQLGWIFYEFDGIGTPRLMCSWKTTDAELDAFLSDCERTMITNR